MSKAVELYDWAVSWNPLGYNELVGTRRGVHDQWRATIFTLAGGKLNEAERERWTAWTDRGRVKLYGRPRYFNPPPATEPSGQGVAVLEAQEETSGQRPGRIHTQTTQPQA